MISSEQIRKKFLNFFESQSHKIVPSAPIVVQNDPTLMFTNAGMNQFKDFFLGNKKSPNQRIADTQKCLRVSGKHNDLEEVGFDTYHHTMFEMLGNWSFGDYFKEESITWAWQLLTKEFGLEEDRLYATVFVGDPTENLEADEEAKSIWRRFLPEDRILYGSKKDNFWEMGDMGPCGPCSEIHIDLRDPMERENISGASLVNNDHPQVVEIWNHVFIQFNRKSDGTLESLPEKHVDTGMGFERLVMAIQGKKSNYDTDLFQPTIQFIAKKAHIVYGENEKRDIAIRVIADHIRAICFTIADGQMPGNAKAGYVIRRILRRAVRYGYTFLDFHEPFLFELVPLLADQFSEVFPELEAQQLFVSRVIKEEETSFLRTLDKGLKKLDFLLQSNAHKISGSDAFLLYDTYGFPPDLTTLIAKESGKEMDQKAFEDEMQAQKERSKAASLLTSSDWMYVTEDEPSVFIGYDFTESSSRIIKYRTVESKGKRQYQLVLDTTPFYAESGGQVGDRGILKNENETIEVIDTKKENDLIIHYVNHIPKQPQLVFSSQVNTELRRNTEKNHSATHLLHAALREVLGHHVQQRGSLVNENLLRFDFSHFAKMTEIEIADVEKKVTEKIWEAIPLKEWRKVPIDEAKKMGAMALFGEKYGEFVRVIQFDSSFSTELCGGTHVTNTSQIGAFKIISETSIAAGVRRIEAITYLEVLNFIDTRLKTLDLVEEELKRPEDPVKAVRQLTEEKAFIQKQLEHIQRKEATRIKSQIINSVKKFNGIAYYSYLGDFPSTELLKNLCFELKSQGDDFVFLAAVNILDKPLISVITSDRLVENRKINAAELVKKLAKEINGGGGGQPFYATAGGKSTEGLVRVIQNGEEEIQKLLG